MWTCTLTLTCMRHRHHHPSLHPATPRARPARPSAFLQAQLLLLEMLDVDKVLAALAGGRPIDEAAYAFAAPGVKQRVNAELACWWGAAAAPHSPVLLSWAAVLCLVGKSEGGSPAGCPVVDG